MTSTASGRATLRGGREVSHAANTIAAQSPVFEVISNGRLSDAAIAALASLLLDLAEREEAKGGVVCGNDRVGGPLLAQITEGKRDA